jgi:hypothetical protein
MRHVTLEARDLAGLERDLRARGIVAEWTGPDGPGRRLQVSDPAGNVIQFAGPPAPAAGVSPGAVPFSGHLQHIGRAVPYALAGPTIAFYRDTLGWPETIRMNAPDGRTALVKFRIPGPGRELIELIFFDPPLNKWAAGAFDHINFEVSGIDATYQALHAGGIATQASHLPTVNGEHLWAINITDPELTRVEIQDLAPTGLAEGTVSAVGGRSARALFDGTTLAGWEGNTANWRVEDGSIVAGSTDRRQPHNEFLMSTEEFGDFELRLQYRVEGTDGFVNGGVQFWSQRVPGGFEVCGYQADLGAGTDGNLYDESRRAVNLATAPAEVRERVLRPGQWNDYRVRAEGPHIQIWLNGAKTVDYTETDRTIPLRGRFALQIHGGAKTKVSYRGLLVEPLPGR